MATSSPPTSVTSAASSPRSIPDPALQSQGPASGSEPPHQPWSPPPPGHCQPLYRPLVDERQQCQWGSSSPWLRVREPSLHLDERLCVQGFLSNRAPHPPTCRAHVCRGPAASSARNTSPWCEGSESPELVPAFSISGDLDASSCHTSPSPCQPLAPPPPVPQGPASWARPLL